MNQARRRGTQVGGGVSSGISLVLNWRKNNETCAQGINNSRFTVEIFNPSIHHKLSFLFSEGKWKER